MSLPQRTRPGPLRGLVLLAWQQALWAIPFTLFFGVLNDQGRGFPVYVAAFKISLVFSYCIGLGLWAIGSFAAPRMRRDADDLSLSHSLRVAAAYSSAAIVGSYVAAFIVNSTIAPGFIGSPRAVLQSGMFTLLFCVLFAGISLAMGFYHHAVDRARAVETMRAELANAELRALRAQINPHFLFNTLNSIAALIRIDPNAAEVTTTRLAEVFRYTLRASDSTHAPLGDELAFVREYLGIEHTRFGDRLRVVESIEPGLEHIQVPGLLLQPLVENAVRYAVSPRIEGGTVRISARREGELLHLQVADDGPGMSEHASTSGNGFGLHSVRERLETAGPPHKFSIRSDAQSGTCIDITLPIEPPASAVAARAIPVRSPQGGTSC